MQEFFLNKNVLVAGGTGFIGSNIIKKLIPLGAQIRGTVYTQDNKKPQIIDPLVEYIRCDLTDKQDCQRIVRDIDYLFMAAANTFGAHGIEEKPLALVTPNIIMNTLLLEAAYEAKVKKVLYISSNVVYPVTDYPVKEEDAKGELFEKYFCPGWMKRFSEILCEMYSSKIKNPMKIIVVRPANAYGPYSDFEWETSHVIPALIRKVVERRKPIDVWGDGNDIKDFIYVEDLVEGMLLAMEKMETYDPINLATGKPCTVKEILNIIIDADGYQGAEIAFDASKPTMIPKRLIDPTKAKEVLGFEAKTPYSEGIKKTIEWYRAKINQHIL